MENNLAYQEEWREEMIGGGIVALASPSMNHLMIAGNIFNLFSNYLRRKECMAIPDGATVYLSEGDRFIPDFSIVCDADKVRPDGIHGAPDLVVEVLSPSTADFDKRHKKDAYERAGVKEYWIISPGEKAIEQYILRDGNFSLDGVYTVYPDWMLKNMKESDRAAVVTEFKCSLYDDLVIRLEDVFARVK